MWRTLHVKRYDEKVLNKLIDKYERSLLYYGKNQVSQTISIPIQKSVLPEYFDESAMQYEVIHEQLEEMEQKGYIRLIWKNKKRGHILQKCELVEEQAEEIYRYLHRTPKNQKEQEILNVCEVYRGKTEVLDNFLTWIENRIRENESVKKYVDIDEPKDFQLLCELIFRILTNESECFLRQFSIKWFHDSKIAEKDIDKAMNIIAEFSGEEMLEEYNIYRNPSWIMIKGNVVLQKVYEGKTTEIDLRLYSGGIGLSNQDIEGIEITSEVEKVVTIENLTSFHHCVINPNEKGLYIYLGGYHNQSKRVFLKKIYQKNRETLYYHFGDIDCGGFRIWKDLCEKTGIPFQTLYMDLEVYEKYLRWGRELTELDRRNLKVMLEDDFYQRQRELFEKMLKEGVKLEQECIEEMQIGCG